MFQLCVGGSSLDDGLCVVLLGVMLVHRCVRAHGVRVRALCVRVRDVVCACSMRRLCPRQPLRVAMWFVGMLHWQWQWRRQFDDDERVKA